MTTAVRRRTKIVATVGPASDATATLRSMIEAGMDMARISLAHGPVEQGLDRVTRVRAAAADAGANVGVLIDLPGPKIRAAPFPEGGVLLQDGARVRLVSASGASTRSSDETIAVDHAQVLDELQPGDLVALGDGGVQLDIEAVHDAFAAAVVRSGGRLQGRPGVNLPPDRFGAPTPTAHDLRLLDAAVEAGVDAVAVSFVRDAQDIRAVRAAARDRELMIVAKIETKSAVDDIDAIIETADGVMVARGDLGVRWPLEDVPHLQKRIIRSGVAYGRPVITATQMLESMVHAPTPTRAEVSDVANAVFDGSSALMLSAETAIGRDPVAAVRTMSTIAARAEADFDFAGWGARLGRHHSAMMATASSAIRVTSAITAAAWRAALDCDAAAIICCTNTGHSARAIARHRPLAPIFAFTRSPRVARQLSVAWGINAVATVDYATTDEIVWFAVKDVVERGHAARGDIVVVLVGSPGDPEPTTDVLRLVRIR
ncbi:MAG TPA: pyruvate kinase [Candidatus Dormibacteraeota bacterium]|nr:pyruvate kinase [Candidatus Dormibacteraeota bacterium]